MCSIQAAFEAQAAISPDVAVRCGDREIRYGELNGRANRIARALRARGALPGARVGVCVERSIDMIAALLGILKAGCAYVPLDPAYPPARLALMAEDAAVAAVVTRAGPRDRLPAGVPALCLDDDAALIEAQDGADPPRHATAESLAYVVYTSGSTGRPKGVAVPHRAVLRLVLGADYISLSPADRVLGAATLSFDASTFEIWGALLNGARLVLAPEQTVLHPPSLAALIRAESISTIFITTALFNRMASAEPEAFRGLRTLLFGGERCDPRWVRAVLDRGAPERLLHVYGPTENTTFSTWHLVREVPEGAATVPIGRPITGTRALVLDDALAPVPPGGEGELYLGGEGLALGYLGDARLTGERFVPDPARPGERLYRTGDRVRLLDDGGTLEFVGRMDQQVKVRGFRVEPREIEAALAQHPGVREAAVIAREDASSTLRLCAYVVAAPGGACEAHELRRHLEARLPAHMIPAVFVALPSLPLTPNGKVDHRALPAPGRGRPALAVDYIAPRSPAEQAVAALWSDVLRVAPVGVHDPFLHLGGDSLAAMQVVSRVRDALGAELPIRALLEGGTVAALAARVEAGGAAHSTIPIARAPRGAPGPLSSAQQRLWFLHELDPASPAYTILIALRLSGPLDEGALRRSLDEIVRRHEALRTTFVLAGDEPAQVVAPAAPMPVQECDEEGLEGAARAARLAEIAREEGARPFDLARGPLARARLVRLAPGERVLFVAIHHIAADGWSMGVLVRELAALYDALAAGLPSPLPPLPLQYTDYAVWQRRARGEGAHDADLAYWKDALAGAPGAIPLGDRVHPDGAAPGSRAGHAAFEISAEVRAALEALGRAEGATLFMTLLAAFDALLHAETGADDLPVGTPVSGRDRAELEDLIGFFVNTLVIRARIAGDPTFRELLRDVRARTLSAYAHGRLPFERLVEALRPARDPGAQPLFNVMFALQSPPADIEARSGLRIAFSEPGSGGAPFDILWQLWDRPPGLGGSVVYREGPLGAEAVARLVTRFERLLVEITRDPDRRLSELAPRDEVPRDHRGEIAELEARLIESPGIDDCAVLLRRDEAGAPRRVGYVASGDPAALARLAGGAPPRALDGLVPLHALPLTAEGRVDEAALRGLEVIDEDLARRWERRLASLPGVAEVAAVIHEPDDPLPRVHLSDLVPGWTGGDSMPASAAAPASASASASAPAPALASVSASVSASASAPAPAAAPVARAHADGGPLTIPEDAPRTLAEALLRTAAAAGDRGITYVEGDGVATTQRYAELLDGARAVLGGLTRAGLRPGDRVILQIDSLRDHFTTFWACVLGGVVPVTVAVPASYEAPSGVVAKLHNVWELLERPAILASRRLAPGLRGLGALFPAMAGVAPLAVEDLREGQPSGAVHPGEPGDVVFLQLSSGSTGVPKCIQETHRGILHHVYAAAQHNGYGPADVSLSWLPVDHVVPILTCHIKDVVLGCAEVMVRTDLVLSSPLLWLDLIEAHRVTHTWSPNFGFKLVSDALARSRRTWDLSSMAFFMNAGEQVTLDVVRDFLRRVEPFGVRPRAMQPAFGMAEVCTCMTYNNDFDAARGVHWVAKSSLGGPLHFFDGDPAERGSAAIPFVDLGPPVPGVEIRIAGADDRVVPEGVIGRLQIRGAVVTPGYLRNEPANREAFVGDGWFNSGDLGFIKGGRLTLTGREKETIIVRGANFYCYEIEDVVSAVPGVSPTFAAATSAPDPAAGTEGLAVFFVPEDPSIEARAAMVGAVRSAVTARLGINPARVVPLPRADFPKTTSGKIQRAALRRSLAEGRFESILREIDVHLGNERTAPDAFHRRAWIRREPPLAAGAARARGRTVIFMDPLGLGARLAAALREAGRPCVTVERGAGYARLDEGRYRLDPRDPAHLGRLLAELSARGDPPGAVVHLFTYGDPSIEFDSAAAIEEALWPGALGVLSLARALPDAPIRLVVASTRAQPALPDDPIDPHKAPLLGLLRTIPQEMPWIDARHVDLGAGAPDDDAPRLLRELDAAPRDREVAYRGDRRLIPRLERVDLTRGAVDAPPLETGGVYLITGGLGGIGRRVARYLLERHRARLVLVGRAPLPGPAGAASARAKGRARAFDELAAIAGSPEDVVYEAADVADRARVSEIVARAEGRWGRPIAGVLHLAGVLHERTIADETPETFLETLRPKLIGGWVLGRILADRPGALFVGASSVNGSLGGFSAGAYAAASRSVEHLAHELRRTGTARAHAIAWSLWDGIGMSGDDALEARDPGSPLGALRPEPRRDLAEARGYLPLSAPAGVASLVAALRRDEPLLLAGLDGRNGHVIPYTGEFHRRPQRLTVLFTTRPGFTPPAGPHEVRDRFGTPSAVRPRRVAEVPRAAGGAIDRDALLDAAGSEPRRAAGPRAAPGRRARAPGHVAPRDEAERIVAEIWRDALGRDRMGALDNFFDLGGHSLLVAQVRVRLQRAFGRDVPLVELFRYPTVAALAAYLGQGDRPRPAPDPADERAPRSPAAEERVAVIGMAGRFPGAADVDTFWAHLRAGVESIRRLTADELAAAGVDPALIRDPRYVPARAALDGVELFDPELFGMSPREAEITDPQHRLFLECALEALERAGCDPARARGAIGVYAGAGPDGYLLEHLAPSRALMDSIGGLPALIGNDRDHLATRVAYKLDLRGPALTVQTACSTSLVAVHLACRALLDRDCDIALAGGVSITFPLGTGYLHEEGSILSPDGHCRAFDASARGTVGGDGAGVVVLKRLSDALEDGDHIHAILRGTAINNDGAAKVGYTAPGVDGQAAVIAKAHAAAGVDPASITYVEAHGTGTPMGDPIEIAALARAFRGAARGSCAVGSVKTNIGHLNTAAGIAGLIKAVLAVERAEIPPSLHYNAPNPEIDFDAGPFFVSAALRRWETGGAPRRAGVSSFGFGGTNAHAVIEEAPPPPPRPPARPWQVLTISARTPEALDAATARVREHLLGRPDDDLERVAWTLQAGRRAFEHRRIVACRDARDAADALAPGSARAETSAPPGAAPAVVLMFPGQGAQRPGMAMELHRAEPSFRRHLDHCADLLAPRLGLDLRRALEPGGDPAALDATALAQPALFAVEYALAQLWMERGVRPAAMIGHSLGEYVAACLAGVLSLEDALALVAARGRLMEATPPGAMLAAPLAESELAALLPAGATIAVQNGAASTVASGTPAAIDELERRLAARGLPSRRLRAARAFHSPLMDAALAPFLDEVRKVALHAPRIPYVSNVTGGWITAEEATDPAYWTRHLRGAVRFHDGLCAVARGEGIARSAPRVLLEVGPGRWLSALAAALDADLPAISTLGAPGAPEPEPAALACATGRLWLAGVDIDWAAVHAPGRPRKIPLPTYPFERRRCWIDRPGGAIRPPAPAPSPAAPLEAGSLEEIEAAVRRRLAIRPLDEYPGLEDALDALCASHVCHFLEGVGVDTREGNALPRASLRRQIGAHPRLERLYDAMIDLLVEDGIARVEGDLVRFCRSGRAVPPPSALRADIEARWPGFSGLLRFLDHCVKSYPDALGGRVEPISVLYPGGSSEFVTRCERDTTPHRTEQVYIELLREALPRLLGAPGRGRRARILEIGGGQGLLTWPLVSALRGQDVEYHFTDIGKVFVDDARAEAARRGLDDLMTFGLLDASRDPRAQGHEPGSFDLVVAFNVVHATPDVRRTLLHLISLLAPGGAVALVEMVRSRRWDLLTWGLAEGWWYFDDDLRRGSPLLGVGAWEDLFRGEGMERVEAYPRGEAARARADHALILGWPRREAR
ncbi:MAG: amino acid adenylation domain-containing protein, partial [Polyangiaceae bacterium]|nr:amino acid adenylation domain-containing protein [Polyangiaceae bacterium]